MTRANHQHVPRKTRGGWPLLGDSSNQGFEHASATVRSFYRQQMAQATAKKYVFDKAT